MGNGDERTWRITLYVYRYMYIYNKENYSCIVSFSSPQDNGGGIYSIYNRG